MTRFFLSFIHSCCFFYILLCSLLLSFFLPFVCSSILPPFLRPSSLPPQVHPLTSRCKHTALGGGGVSLFVYAAHLRARHSAAGMNNMNDKYLIMYQSHYWHSKYTPDSAELKGTALPPHMEAVQYIFTTIIPHPQSIISNALGYSLLIVDSCDPNLF